MKRIFKVLSLLAILLLAEVGWAQEEKDTPSQKTKEAIEKFKKGPSVLGKSVEALKEAGKAKLQEALGTKAPAKEATDLTTLPTKKPEQAQPRYSSAGKRDPFRPLTLQTKAAPGARARVRENLSPLERYEIGQLKLVGIIWDIKEPKAMVEDATGLGYIIKVGTLIGSNEGKVKAIKATEVVIEERFTDLFGATKSREVPMKLPAE